MDYVEHLRLAMAEAGRPLHLIQKALGHTDIWTTQDYLMSNEQAVIEAMQS